MNIPDIMLTTNNRSASATDGYVLEILLNEG